MILIKQLKGKSDHNLKGELKYKGNLYGQKKNLERSVDHKSIMNRSCVHH